MISVDKLDNIGIQYVPGVGPSRAKLLHKLNIHTVKDLLYYFPRRYEDFSCVVSIQAALGGERQTIEARVIGISEKRPRKGLTITEIGFSDGTGTLYGVWFNQSYIKRQWQKGMVVRVSGKAERKYGRIQMSRPMIEAVEKAQTGLTGRIIPFYPLTEGLQPNLFRKIVHQSLQKYGTLITDFMPEAILERFHLSSLSWALQEVHFPQNQIQLDAAQRRLIFEELLVLQLGMGIQKKHGKQDVKGIQHQPDGSLMNQMLQQLPYTLTGAQQKVWDDIKKDMEYPYPMQRLVQGDVGSGKTLVAVLALLKAVESGFQAAMMAPTEILARQHYQNLSELFSPLGIKIDLLSGRLTPAQKNHTLQGIATGEIQVVVGTHALIQEGVTFADLSLVITDEQHRFGVKQRASFQQKGKTPDVLVMTATPIPRTLALTVFGDLDISIIDELPPGRKSVKTYWVTSEMEKRVYGFLQKEVAAGRQVYIVCPLVEESEQLQVESAVHLYNYLKENIFRHLTLGLLYGKMKSEEKEAVMDQFYEGQIQILVATTVIEVGVNVPNASVMVIKDADRFGLAQLHQLRGRVGRGSDQSYCILIADPTTEEGKQRMGVMQSTADGFKVADEDLKLRGPGEFFGVRQHGLPDLKIANILRDVALMELAQKVSAEILADNVLLQSEYQDLKIEIENRFSNKDICSN